MMEKDDKILGHGYRAQPVYSRTVNKDGTVYLSPVGAERPGKLGDEERQARRTKNRTRKFRRLQRLSAGVENGIESMRRKKHEARRVKN